MDIALPYSRDRRYLTGVDWIIGVLDCMTRRATGTGNSSQIILELEGRLDTDLLRDAINRFAAQLPVISGRPARDRLNLAPFWKMNGRTAPPPLAVHTMDESARREDALALLCRAAEAPFPSPHDHLAFNLVHAGGARSFLGMAFDHWLFDARGAELFLDHLSNWTEKPAPLPRELTHPTREPCLSRWADKFRAGRNVNRAIRALAPLDAAKFAIPKTPGGRLSFRHQFQMLDESESRRVTESAYAMSGYLVQLPYLLALAVEAVDRVLAARGLAPGHYVIPVSIDRRAARADSQALFFNHFSFVHFTVSREHLASRESLVKSIAAQMYEQTKSRLPEDFEQVMMLMRILPVGALAGLARRLFGGNFGSFIFSCVGRGAHGLDAFLGRRVVNLLHTPRVSTPPGIGVFINEFGGKMNVTTAYLEGILDDGEAAKICGNFRPAS